MRTSIICVVLCVLAVFLIVFDEVDAQSANENTSNGFVSPSLLEVMTVEFAADPYSKANYDPFIKLRVYNNSPEVITRAYIDIEFTADSGRHLLFREKFVQIVNGGLRPYSYAEWKFYPRGSSAIALKGLPRDTQASARVDKLFCPKKNSPWQYEHRFKYPARHDFAR